MEKALSIQLDLARLFAAVLVFFHHLEHITRDKSISLLASFGHDAVIFFFLLSGFVIAYVTTHREHTIEEFFIARLARLYSVCAPALVLSLILTLVGIRLQPDRYIEHLDADWPRILLSSLLFINQTSITSVQIPTNAPYWSISYEAWYYIMFAFAVYLRGWIRFALLTSATLVAGIKILTLFPIWLLGAGCHRHYKRLAERPTVGWIALIASFSAYIVIRALNLDDALFKLSTQPLGGEAAANELLNWSKRAAPDLLISILFIVMLYGYYMIRHQLSSILLRHEASIRNAAAYTFSIYLFHYPLLYFFAGVFQSTALISLSCALAILILGYYTERNKSLLATKLGAALAMVTRHQSMPKD